MKIEMRDREDQRFEVGYEWIMNDELGYEEPLFWIDTPYECVTLQLDKKQLDHLASAIQFLKGNV